MDGDVTKSYRIRMNVQFMFEFISLFINCISHKHNLNSLAAVLHINRSNVAVNRKRFYTPGLGL